MTQYNVLGLARPIDSFQPPPPGDDELDPDVGLDFQSRVAFVPEAYFQPHRLYGSSQFQSTTPATVEYAHRSQSQSRPPTTASESNGSARNVVDGPSTRRPVNEARPIQSIPPSSSGPSSTASNNPAPASDVPQSLQSPQPLQQAQTPSQGNEDPSKINPATGLPLSLTKTTSIRKENASDVSEKLTDQPFIEDPTRKLQKASRSPQTSPDQAYQSVDSNITSNPTTSTVTQSYSSFKSETSSSSTNAQLPSTPQSQVINSAPANSNLVSSQTSPVDVQEKILAASPLIVNNPTPANMHMSQDIQKQPEITSSARNIEASFKAEQNVTIKRPVSESSAPLYSLMAADSNSMSIQIIGGPSYLHPIEARIVAAGGSVPQGLYQWMRSFDGSKFHNIIGATSQVYRPTIDDIDVNLRVTFTPTYADRGAGRVVSADIPPQHHSLDPKIEAKIQLILNTKEMTFEVGMFDEGKAKQKAANLTISKTEVRISKTNLMSHTYKAKFNSPELKVSFNPSIPDKFKLTVGKKQDCDIITNPTDRDVIILTIRRLQIQGMGQNYP